MQLKGIAVAPGTVTARIRFVGSEAGHGPVRSSEGWIGWVETVDRAITEPAGASRGPLGWVVGHAIASVPPVSPSVPIVAGLSADLFQPGDRVALDGRAGTVELMDVTPTAVVTSFLQRPDGRILLLRRSAKVGSFQGRWAGVSGFLESPTAREQALREISEETSVKESELELAREGAPVLSRAGDRMYVVTPFRWKVGAPTIRLDWEHTEFDWVDPASLADRPMVPKLEEAWAAVAGDPPSHRTANG